MLDNATAARGTGAQCGWDLGLGDRRGACRGRLALWRGRLAVQVLELMYSATEVRVLIKQANRTDTAYTGTQANAKDAHKLAEHGQCRE